MIGLRRRGIDRVPTVQQSGMSECGAACLAMVMSAYGKHTSIAECRDLLGIGRDGTSMRNLAAVARDMGMTVRPLKVGIPELRSIRLPAIAHWGQAHYLVVEKVTSSAVHVVDPGAGRRRLSHDEARRGLSGVVLEMVPAAGFTPRSAPVGDGLHWAVGLLRHGAGRLAAAVLVSLLLHGAVLGFLLTGAPLVADVIAGGADDDALALLAALLVGAPIVIAMVGYARHRLLIGAHLRLQTRLSRYLVDRILALPLRYFEASGATDLMSRASSGFGLRQVITQQFIALLVDSALAVVYTVLLLVAAPVFALPVLVVAVLSTAVLWTTRGKVNEASQREKSSYGEAQGRILDAIRGIETIKGMGRETVVVSDWASLAENMDTRSRRHLSLESRLDAVLLVLRVGGPFAVLGVALTGIASNDLSLSGAIVLGACSALLIEVICRLAVTTRRLPVIRHHLAQISGVLAEPVEQKDTPARRAVVFPPQIEIRDLCFRYSKNSAFGLSDVCLTLPAGGKVGLVGRSGSGKSTLARLVLGLHRPTKGSIRFDGREVGEFDLRDLRSHFGVVPQDASFFSSTIRANIAFGCPGADQAMIEAAAEKAQLHDDIIAMPLGYDTPLSDGGSGGGLSSGQRQRLALARALVGDPRLVVLDEATSHLDTATERRIEEQLSTLACTRLVIAHRMSAVRDADMIVVLEDGRVVETGTHDDLISRGGAYAALAGEPAATVKHTSSA